MHVHDHFFLDFLARPVPPRPLKRESRDIKSRLRDSELVLNLDLKRFSPCFTRAALATPVGVGGIGKVRKSLRVHHR
jgi:hypothetical protein